MKRIQKLQFCRVRIIITVLLLVLVTGLFAQKSKSDPFAIQFSGIVVTEDEKTGEVIPLPYTNISIKGTSRGTISALDGFFSIVALRGDTISFSYLGYQTVEYVLPDSLDKHYYSYYQIMSKDDILLPEAVIYPWPSREYFKQEFLAMDVNEELQQKARENLAEEVLRKMINEVPGDANEAINLQLRQQAEAATWSGQFRPMKIFDLVSWQKFIKAWKNGDFKRKKED
jgi:hypothetical protein